MTNDEHEDEGRNVLTFNISCVSSKPLLSLLDYINSNYRKSVVICCIIIFHHKNVVLSFVITDIIANFAIAKKRYSIIRVNDGLVEEALICL